MNGENGASKIGRISLWAGVLGVIVPVVIALVVRAVAGEGAETYYLFCFLLFAGAELTALVTGIVGRKSPYGKAGLGISCACIVVTALAIPAFTVRRGEPVPTETQSSPDQGQ